MRLQRNVRLSLVLLGVISLISCGSPPDPFLPIPAIEAVPEGDSAPMFEATENIIPDEEADEAELRGEPVREFLRRVTTPEEKKRALARRVQIGIHKNTAILGHEFLTVALDRRIVHTFTVSTAKERELVGKSGRKYFAYTPEGVFFPEPLERNHWSTLWQVNLPYTIPFQGGVLIHATTPDHYGELGRPSSGGCVRLHLHDAKVLWELVLNAGGSKSAAITVYPRTEKVPDPIPKAYFETHGPFRGEGGSKPVSPK